MKSSHRTVNGPSRQGWALLLFVLAVAVFLRFWQLGDWPPGLYRDEAYNGLDGLGVLNGSHPLFFTANNGREPAYIYLTSLFIRVFGRTATAVRLGSAIAGSLTTLLVYRLGSEWFDQRVGLLCGWLWAVTLWPVHLSRIGLRPLLLVPAMIIVFLLGTWAYRSRRQWLWLAAGLAYGVSYYTYLAARFTPVLIALIFLFFLWQRKEKQIGSGFLWFGLGTAAALGPLLFQSIQSPDLLLGRTGQVSIFNPAVNGGDFWGMAVRQIGAVSGMFFWRGDTILRHNPSGRPLFDLFAVGPFLIGLGWSLKRWRQPGTAITLLWTAVMLGPTILAEDAPHFLRAVGILPAVLIVPAVGLAQIWQWPRIPVRLRQSLVIGLALGSFGVTVRDYAVYSRDPDTGYLFEQAARQLANDMNSQVAGTAVWVDDRYWSGWPSISFLTKNPDIYRFSPAAGLSPVTAPAVIFSWPYDDIEFIPAAFPETAMIFPQSGPLARGDLEPDAYPLYTKYTFSPAQDETVTALFGDELLLLANRLSTLTPTTLQVDLVWESRTAVPHPLTTFIHVLHNGQIFAQDDTPPGGGLWPSNWFRPGIQLQDRHTLILPAPFDPARHQVIIGLYDSQTGDRLPVFDSQDQPSGDAWILSYEN